MSSKKPLLLFKSLTGIRIEEFDSIYKNEIAKRYGYTKDNAIIERINTSIKIFKLKDKSYDNS
jgi:hypothetical protein